MPSSDSAVTTGSVTFQGVRLHDPLDAESTIRAYRYGANQRSDNVSIPATALQYAGRTYPVIDYGDHQEHSVTTVVDVPHGPTWRDNVNELILFAESRRTLAFRDNRGRVVFGGIFSVRVEDVASGSRVTFTVQRIDYDSGEQVAA